MDKLALTLPGGPPDDPAIEITDPLEGKFSDIGDIFSALLPYVFILAGLAMMLYLIWGGFELMTSGGNPESTKKAQSKITNAVVGFVVIFISYWLIQILEVILGIEILGI